MPMRKTEVSSPTSSEPPPLGIVINPLSGRDARRLFARAQSSSHESKRNQVERLIVGAAAAGVKRVVLVGDPFRIANAAVEALGVGIEIDLRDVGASAKPADTVAAVDLMRREGCGALVVLGGDGTSRIVASHWPDVAMLPLSTGTNNVFPQMIEATVAGAAAGFIATGRVAREDGARRAKVIHVEVESEGEGEGKRGEPTPHGLALIDAVQIVDDIRGNLLPFDPERLRTLVLSRALPWAVGMSPIGGLLRPCSAEDDFAVRVECAPRGASARELLAPISPGLYRKVRVAACEELPLGERVEVKGPGLLAFDGDRERVLARDERAWLRVERDGPWVVDVERTLQRAAEGGFYLDTGHWHDSRDDGGLGCC